MENQSIIQRLRGKIKFFPSYLAMETKDIDLSIHVETIIPNLKSGVLYIRNDLSPGYFLYWIVDGNWYLMKETRTDVGKLFLQSKCGIFKNYTKKELENLTSIYSSLSQKQRNDLLRYSFFFSNWRVRRSEHKEFLKSKRTWGQ
jgi:hypothetical protein